MQGNVRTTTHEWKIEDNKTIFIAQEMTLQQFFQMGETSFLNFKRELEYQVELMQKTNGHPEEYYKPIFRCHFVDDFENNRVYFVAHCTSYHGRDPNKDRD